MGIQFLPRGMYSTLARKRSRNISMADIFDHHDGSRVGENVCNKGAVRTNCATAAPRSTGTKDIFQQPCELSYSFESHLLLSAARISIPHKKITVDCFSREAKTDLRLHTHMVVSDAYIHPPRAQEVLITHGKV